MVEASSRAHHPGTRETAVEVDRTFVAAARLEAGLTQQEFARATGASLDTGRKGKRGERSPSAAARMLAPILARDPALVIAEAGLAESSRKQRGGVGWRDDGRDRIDRTGGDLDRSRGLGMAPK